MLRDALACAREDFENDVCSTTLSELSDVDVEFLGAMAADDGPSRVSGVAERMGVTVDYAQKYRRRLINAGVIEPARRGYVRFAVPYLANHMRRARLDWRRHSVLPGEENAPDFRALRRSLVGRPSRKALNRHGVRHRRRSARQRTEAGTLVGGAPRALRYPANCMA